jgi:hypothetical protein
MTTLAFAHQTPMGWLVPATALTPSRMVPPRGVVAMFPVDWTEVHRIAERLSAARTKTEGHRALDILHVATARVLQAQEFLTFDERQSKLAQAEGLKVKP